MSSLLKTVLGQRKRVCYNVMITWNSRPGWCFLLVDLVKHDPDVCVEDVKRCSVLRVLIAFAGCT